MADRTISFKVEDEMIEKARELIEASGGSSKEWFQKAVTLAEIQSTKEMAGDYASDLTELEAHTSRIYELISNVVQKSIYLKESSIKDIEKQLDDQRDITSKYQERVKELENELLATQGRLEESAQEQANLADRLEDTRQSAETNKLLVDEYKEKNDTLNGLLAKYENYATENEELKQELSDQQKRHDSEMNTHIQETKDKEGEVQDLVRQTEKLEQAMASQTERHRAEMEHLKNDQEIKNERALLNLQREHQEMIAASSESYNDKIQALYAEFNQQREKYERKIDTLQDKIDSLQSGNSADQ